MKPRAYLPNAPRGRAMNRLAWLGHIALVALPLSACADSASSGPPAPQIIGQPTAVTAVPGTPASFTVQVAPASGVTLSYQWRRNGGAVGGVNFVGATSPMLRILAVSAADTGSYSVSVTASRDVKSATTQSAAAQLTINSPPLIVSQPTTTTGSLDSAASISVVAVPAGGGTLTFQWLVDGRPITDDGIRVGTNTATMKWWAVRSTDGGVYSVLVGSELNATLSYSTSDTARLLVHYPPVLSSFPQATEFLEGSVATLPLTVTGQSGDSLAYQWYKGPFPLADTGRFHGARTPTLTIEPVMAVDAAAYAFEAISTLNGTRTSAYAIVAQLDVITAPVISVQPISHAVDAGSPIYIGVSVEAQPYSFVYQWQKDGLDLLDDGRITRTTTPDLVIYNAVASDAGNYRVKVSSVLGNAALTTISADAVITIK